MKGKYKILVVALLNLIVLLSVVAIISDVNILQYKEKNNSGIHKIKIITTSEGKYAVRNVIRTPIEGWERIEPTRRGHYDVMPEWTKSTIISTNVNKLDPIIKSYVDGKNYYLQNVSIPLLLHFDSENSTLTFRGSFSNITQIVDKNKIKLKVSHNNLLDNNESSLHIERLVNDSHIVRIETIVEPLERIVSNQEDIDVMHLSYSQMGQKEEDILRSMGVNIDAIYSGYMQIYTTESKIRELAELYFVTRIEDSDKIIKDLNYAKKITAVDEVVDYWNKVYGYSIKGKNIKVAVIDTGYDETNPYLKNATVKIHYYNCGGSTCNDSNITDTHPDGHGTHVAGIIVNNHSIYSGVAPDVDLYFYKIGDCNQSGCAGYIDDAIYNAVYVYSVDIISMSTKPNGTSNEGIDVYSRAMDNVSMNGTIIFISAGNIGESGITATGGAKDAITVGATSHWGNVSDFYDAPNGDRDAVAWYSSHGDTSDGRDKPDIVAPGGTLSSSNNCSSYYGMISTRANNTGDNSCSPENYMIKMAGTSMATPFAAGVAALILNATPDNFLDMDERVADVKALLLATSQKVDISQDGADSGYWSDEMGHGRIDLHNAMWRSLPNKEITLFGDEISPGNYSDWDVEIPEGTIYFKVVVAWSDPPTSSLVSANGVTCALLNDIDLNVTGPGISNVSNSECNPVEYVEFYDEDGIPAGNYTIRIIGDSSRFNSSSQVIGGAYVHYTKKPDLHITGLSPSSGMVPPGESFSVSLSVTNRGTVTAPGVDAIISYDDNAFNLTSGEDNPLLGSIGGLVVRPESRSYSWTFQTNSSASRGWKTITVNVSDSNEEYTDSESISVLLMEHSLSVSISNPTYNISPSSSFNVTAHVYNDGDLNASNVSATINLPSGLSTSNLTKTISFIEVNETENVTWNVTASSTDNVAYAFSVDVNSSAYGMNFTDSAISCAAVSSTGETFCMILPTSWNLVSLPLIMD